MCDCGTVKLKVITRPHVLRLACITVYPPDADIVGTNSTQCTFMIGSRVSFAHFLEGIRRVALLKLRFVNDIAAMESSPY